MEDIKRDYEETSNRHTKDRILRSRNDSPARVTSVGNRTHKDSLDEKNIQRIRRSMLGLTQTSRV